MSHVKQQSRIRSAVPTCRGGSPAVPVAPAKKNARWTVDAAQKKKNNGHFFGRVRVLPTTAAQTLALGFLPFHQNRR
jgi:hypothetical protein